MRRKAQYLALAGLLSVGVLVGDSSAVRPAAAAASVSALTFSTEMTTAFEPAGLQGVYFGSDNNGVWVTFTYTDLPPGSQLTRVVRFGTEDFNYDSDTYGRLTCCPQGGSGRYGFPILRISGQHGEVPGGPYSVHIYLNGQEIQNGGFGVRGDIEDDDELPGGDNDNDDDDDDDDDDD